MVNIEKYMEDCSAKAKIAYQMLNSKVSKNLSKKEAFRLRYFCYVEWGVHISDLFNKDCRVARFFYKVLDISYEYTDDYANFGWDKNEVASSFKKIKRLSRFIGYHGQFKVHTYGRRVKVYVGDYAYSIKNAVQAVEVMYSVADLVAGECASEEISDFAGSFMTREYRWMNAISFS